MICALSLEAPENDILVEEEKVIEVPSMEATCSSLYKPAFVPNIWMINAISPTLKPEEEATLIVLPIAFAPETDVATLFIIVVPEDTVNGPSDPFP